MKFTSYPLFVWLIVAFILVGCGSNIYSETNSISDISASKALTIRETAVFSDRFWGKPCGTIPANTPVTLGVSEEGVGTREEVIFSATVCNGTVIRGYVSRSSLKYPTISITGTDPLLNEPSQSGEKLVSFYINNYEKIRSWVNQPWFIPRWSPSPVKSSCVAHSTVALYRVGFNSPFVPEISRAGEIVENSGDIYASVNVYSLTKWLENNGWKGGRNRHGLAKGDYVFSATNGQNIDHVYVFVSYGDSAHTYAKILDNQKWGVHDRSLVGTESIGRYMYHYRHP